MDWVTIREGDSVGKESACQCKRPRFDPLWGRYPGEGNGHPLQYSCLKNPMDVEACWATVHGVAKSSPQLSIAAQPFLVQKLRVLGGRSGLSGKSVSWVWVAREEGSWSVVGHRWVLSSGVMDRTCLSWRCSGSKKPRATWGLNPGGTLEPSLIAAVEETKRR